eukprot:TRINITY_DN1397_c0_g1_i7.p1 TRINITY_DN1397_c0_g1~~TRINITY_DN1397_c0_g1_i7.p1  ORF type:complete len:403 (+),score=133.19 TRINITY_DN1397_c0_g1_i7:104-1312(+)
MKLYYFDVPGKAESIRLLLTHAGIKFEDIRFTMETWPAHKDKFELKQVPVLENNGKMYCQGDAILEYLGRKYGYLPKSNPEAHYKIMKIINTVTDLFMAAYPIMAPYSPLDEKAKGEYMTKLLKEKGPVFLKSIENALCENECKDFIVGNKYTIADFVLLGAYRMLKTVETWSKAFHEKVVRKFPVLYAYLEKRMRDFNTYYGLCKNKLYYFDTPGRAEMIRMLLKHLKIEFEDVRYTKEEWPKIKALGKFELNQLPAFECETCGLKLCQSDAIMQWLGMKNGMVPRDNEKFYDVLWWTNTVNDVVYNCVRLLMPLSEEKKKEIEKDLYENKAKNFFHAMEERLKKCESKDHLVGKETTIAEFYLVAMYRSCLLIDPFKNMKEVMEKYPKLKEFIEKKHKEY